MSPPGLGVGSTGRVLVRTRPGSDTGGMANDGRNDGRSDGRSDGRKTRPGTADVDAFLDGVADERRRTDAKAARDLIAEVTGAEPVMWGSSMIGFGTQRYTTADGKEHEWFAVGLSPRKAALDALRAHLLRVERRPARAARSAQHRQGLPVCEEARRPRPRRAHRADRALLDREQQPPGRWLRKAPWRLSRNLR